MTATDTVTEGTAHRRPLGVILTGAGLGLAWGIAARLWMRFIAEYPEFSWSGTGYILGASTLAGACLAAAWRQRQAGGQAWRLWGVSILGLGMGAGAIMLPTVFLWGAALAGRRWKAWVRALLVPAGLSLQQVVVGDFPTRFGALETTVAAAAYLALLATEAAAFSIVLRPLSLSSATDRRPPQTADPAADNR